MRNSLYLDTIIQIITNNLEILNKDSKNRKYLIFLKNKIDDIIIHYTHVADDNILEKGFITRSEQLT